MSRARILALAGATALLSTATFAALSTETLAADLPPPLPPPVYRPVVVETGGWYLRGDVGVGMQTFKSFDFVQTNPGLAVWPASWTINVKDIKDTFILGGGIGYQWNNWFRFDFTAEHRADIKWKAVGSYAGAADFCTGGTCFDVYDGNHSAFVLLANVYFDLGTWWCLTPFVGFGAGGAYHKTAGVTDIGLIAGGTSAFGHTLSDASKWTFAWAAHAGLAYNVTNTFKVEFSYRYLNFGDATTAEIICGPSGCGGGSGPRAYYNLTGFESHDLRIGVRWLLQPDAPPAPPPLIRKG